MDKIKMIYIFYNQFTTNNLLLIIIFFTIMTVLLLVLKINLKKIAFKLYDLKMKSKKNSQ